MTDFKAIKGFNVKSLAADPKSTGVAGATWASGGNLNTNRNEALNAGLGIQTAALAVSASNNLNVESYDGSSWTEINNVNVKRYYIIILPLMSSKFL
jgi:hypothetical protein